MKPEVDTPQFYMTCIKRESLNGVPEEVGASVMQNAVEYHNTDGFKPFDGYDANYVIDSGGYTAMDKYGGEFPWTVEEYDAWLAETYGAHAFDWAAVMDFACEPAFDDLLTVRERMKKTLHNTIDHFELDPDYPLLPVLQGRTIDDYLTYYDWLQDYGLPTEHVGLGTVCRLSSSSEIVEVENAVRANTDIEKIHGFGVKISSFNHGATFDTADSQAWTWPMKFGLKLVLDGTDDWGVPTIHDEPYGDASDHAEAKRTSFKSYYKRASGLQKRAIQNRRGTPTALSDYA